MRKTRMHEVIKTEMVASPEPNKQAAELRGALLLLRSVLENSPLANVLDDDARVTTQMVYTNGVTLWLLILQRLCGGQTLDQTVQYVLQHASDLLPQNKRVREQTLSRSTSAYARARKRVSLSLIHQISSLICKRLSEMSPPFFNGQRAFILDGTTITLPPTPALRKAYPPATNQHGESVWPIAQLMVASEVQSGCVLLPQIDPMYGEQNASEAEQARRIMLELPPNSLILADAAFGIYSIMHHVVARGHDGLLRMSHHRYQAVQRDAQLVAEGPNFRTYQKSWKPSTKDRLTNPELAEDAAVDVRLHEVRLPCGDWLYLVTSLAVDATTAADLYRRRYDVEFDIRDLKVTMDTERIRARSLDMVHKELYTSIVAYNLVAQFRRQAASANRVLPRRLRFTSVWTCFQYQLLYNKSQSVEVWLQQYDTALRTAGQMKVPNRSKPRSYPRQAHPRRPKTTNHQKKKRIKKPNEPPE